MDYTEYIQKVKRDPKKGHSSLLGNEQNGHVMDFVTLTGVTIGNNPV